MLSQFIPLRDILCITVKLNPIVYRNFSQGLSTLNYARNEFIKFIDMIRLDTKIFLLY
jgi:hypothetical protein